MCAVEFAGVPEGTAEKVSMACYKHNLVCGSTGAYESMMFCPPLIITKEELSDGLRMFEEALKDVFGSGK